MENIGIWIVFQSEYLEIQKEKIVNRKTPIYHIWSIKNKCHIGEIKWFSRWRKYCLYPDLDTIWDEKCIKDILEFLEKLKEK